MAAFYCYYSTFTVDGIQVNFAGSVVSKCRCCQSKLGLCLVAQIRNKPVVEILLVTSDIKAKGEGKGKAQRQVAKAKRLNGKG